MQRFLWHRNLSALVVILGLSIVSCGTQGKCSPVVSSDSYSATTPQPEVASQTVVQAAFDNLPLSFEANQGQSDAQGQFLSHNRGYSVSLAPTEATITLHSPSGHAESRKRRMGKKLKEEQKTPQSTIDSRQSTVLRLQLVGANPQATASGVEELPGRVNYISGKDQTKWHTNIPSYAKVQYEDVYPGVNLLYYGNDQRRLEYDFQVAPGADPARIRLKFTGVDSLNVNDAGELVLYAAGRELRQHQPQIYQEVAGIRRPVSGSYTMTGAHEVGFALGEYDTSRPLVIDPVIIYSTYAGGVNSDAFTGDHDAGNDIAVDAAGNIYVVATANAVNRYDTDVLVRKFNPSGSALLYATYLDSNETNDLGNGIAVDSVGNAYVTGQFGDPLLPGWANGVLVAKLSPTGVPVYEGTFGANTPGYSMDEGMRIAVDDTGSAYIVGTTYGLGTPFPTTPTAFQRNFAGGFSDAFVAKVNPSGTDLTYSTLLGGTGSDEGWGIAIRKVGGVYNAYVTGTTSLPDFGVPDDFPTTPGSLQPQFGGASDVFVTQVNDTGSALVYSTYLGGNGLDKGLAIAVDAAGNAYLTGLTGIEPLDAVSRFPIVNAFQPVYGGEGGATPAEANAFVAKLNPTGSALVYSSYMGGGGYGLSDAGLAIKVDGAGYAYLTGVTGTKTDIFTGSHFPIVNAFQQTPGGGTSTAYNDAFVAKVSPQGALLYSSYLGGNYEDEGHGIAVDTAGNVYLTGATESADFPITPGAYQPQIAGGGCSYPFSCPDAFVTKISNSNSIVLTVTKAGTGSGTVTSSPAGISCGTDCSESYATDTVVTLTAAPATGSTFTGWSGSCTGTGTCSVTLSAAKSVTATFAKPRYTLTVTKAGTGSGTVTSNPAGVSCGGDCSEPYDSGTVVTLTAAPATGSTFTGWSGSCTGTGTCSVTLSAAKSVTATFTAATTVSITATDASATEAGRTTGTFTVTRTGSTAAALTVYYTAGGQATATSDYTALSGSVIISAGATAATLVVTPVDDTLAEPNESVTVNLNSNTAYSLAAASSATVLIKDNDTKVSIATTDATATEAGRTTGTFRVTRVGNTSGALTVRYAVTGTATGGSDYVRLSGSVNIPSGATTATIVVTPVDDTLVESNETVVVTLSSNSAYTVAAPSAGTVTISSNE